ncbi:hypothetical protein OHB26_39415 (plasmid) [Nocardia sp. NBC_01503]|uniref:hypothetical protein n=1 Tax=Nocardia sp. NBC_01503 TaxID=2975997 RepID=UPI002E7BFDA8|nr:hypothetical protein [Nocardia sp. NBC_01503]WTL36699.1 hypothetical protein OHB26_39160 [Nocardia sp. NBC_01503]WTL36748.1 hypothetical protein OHB26_39415 [Nocardia sp. NBC_01503]
MKLTRSKPKTPPPDTQDLVLTGALPDRAQHARDRVAEQYDTALTEALSERELRAERELAELVRDTDRAQQAAIIQSQAAAADRLRRTTAALADQKAKALIGAGKAIAEQRLSASPHAKVDKLRRRKPIALGILTAVLVAGMVISAFQVQHNIAPTGGVKNSLWWLAFGVEGLISGMLIALMLSTSDTAEWGVIDTDDLRTVYAIEGGLLAAMIGLNVFPFARAHEWFQMCVHGIAPIAVGGALLVHRVVARRYGKAIEKATAAIPDHEDLDAQLTALSRIGQPVRAVSERLTNTEPSVPVSAPLLQSTTPAPSASQSNALESAASQIESAPAPRSDAGLSASDSIVSQQTEEAQNTPVRELSAAAEQPVGGPATQPLPPVSPEHSPIGHSPEQGTAALYQELAEVQSARRYQRGTDTAEMLMGMADQLTAHQEEGDPDIEEPEPAEADSAQLMVETAARSESMQKRAATVKEMTNARSDVDRIALVLAYHDATRETPSQIGRALGVGFTQVRTWVDADEMIRNENGGARVLPLRGK